MYILCRNEDLFLGSDSETRFQSVHQYMVTRLDHQNEKREAWNNLVEFCIDRQFPFSPERNNTFFRDNTNKVKVKVKKTVDFTELEPEPAIISDESEDRGKKRTLGRGRGKGKKGTELEPEPEIISDDSGDEYGAKKRTIGRGRGSGRGKGKKSSTKKKAKSGRTIPFQSPAPVNPRSTRSGPSNHEEEKEMSSLSASDTGSLEIAPSTSKSVLPQIPKVSTGVTPSESSKRKRSVSIETNSNARVAVSTEVGNQVVQVSSLQAL